MIVSLLAQVGSDRLGFDLGRGWGSNRLRRCGRRSGLRRSGSSGDGFAIASNRSDYGIHLYRVALDYFYILQNARGRRGDFGVYLVG